MTNAATPTPVTSAPYARLPLRARDNDLDRRVQPAEDGFRYGHGWEDAGAGAGCPRWAHFYRQRPVLPDNLLPRSLSTATPIRAPASPGNGTVYDMLHGHGHFQTHLLLANSASETAGADLVRMLDDPEARLTVFVVSDRSYSTTSPAIIADLDLVDAKAFVSGLVLPYEMLWADMRGRMVNARSLQTEWPLRLDGRGLNSVRVGRRYLTNSIAYANDLQAEIVLPDVRATNGIIHVVSSLPVLFNLAATSAEYRDLLEDWRETGSMPATVHGDAAPLMAAIAPHAETADVQERSLAL
jgi:hypothetical protein